jgi:hypothetical protein
MFGLVLFFWQINVLNGAFSELGETLENNYGDE